MSLWWAKLRHRLFCGQGRFCYGHTFFSYPKYPAYERQFGRAERWYPSESIWKHQ
jgi:hypothetical protein